ncbi:MAG: CidA/LrgA family protein [Alphaproteobacteria bacterium]|nr:CidA/LrgA family protein [Alphaproteobacteria bacterium]
MLLPLLALFACQLAGEVLQAVLNLPVPGPVLGMVILLAGLFVRGGIPEPLAHVANGILAHLSLLFVPAGVGVLLHFSRIQAEWLAIVAALVGSTWLTLVVTVFVMRLASRLLRVDEDDEEHAA